MSELQVTSNYSCLTVHHVGKRVLEEDFLTVSVHSPNGGKHLPSVGAVLWKGTVIGLKNSVNLYHANPWCIAAYL